MLLEISRSNRQPRIANIPEHKLRTMKNIFLLSKGINKIIYTRKLQLEIIDKYGQGCDVVYLMIPETIEDDKVLVKCNSKQIEITRERIECSENTQIIVLCDERSFNNDN